MVSLNIHLNSTEKLSIFYLQKLFYFFYLSKVLLLLDLKASFLSLLITCYDVISSFLVVILYLYIISNKISNNECTFKTEKTVKNRSD